MVDDDEQPFEHFDGPAVRWWPALALSFVIMLVCLPLVLWASTYGEWTCTAADFDRARLTAPGSPGSGAASLWQRRSWQQRCGTDTVGITSGLVPRHSWAWFRSASV